MGGVIRPTGLSRPGSASPPDEFCEERRLCPAAPLLLSARAVVTACRCQRAARSLGHPRPGSRVSREDERGAGVEGSSAAPPRRGPFLQAAKSPRGESVAEGLRATSPQKTRPKESAAEGGGAPPSFSRPPSGSRGKALPLTRQGGDAADRASPPMKEAAGSSPSPQAAAGAGFCAGSAEGAEAAGAGAVGAAEGADSSEAGAAAAGAGGAAGAAASAGLELSPGFLMT